MEFDGTVSRTGPCLDTVRALHQTVVSLRAALEQSRNEILELKSKSWPIDSVQDTVKALAIENHVLRQKLIQDSSGTEVQDNSAKPPIEAEQINEDNINNCKSLVSETVPNSSDKKDTEENTVVKTENNNILITTGKLPKKVKIISPCKSPRNLEARISIRTETFSAKKISRSLESLTIINTPLVYGSDKKLTVSKTLSFSNLSGSKKRKYSEIREEFSKNITMNDDKNCAVKDEYVDETDKTNENEMDQDQEVDDIELIFTTDETKDSDFKEQLVSIDADESNGESSHHLRCPMSDDQNLDISDRELDDDVFNDNYDGENQENLEYQGYGGEYKNESSQIYNSKSDNSINQEEKSLKSYYSYQDSSFENKSLEKDESFDRFEERIRIVETDISKCGIHDVEYAGIRRNTCPNPLQYRPLLHREALSKGFNSRKSRPILVNSNAVRRESGAQTDISALPGSTWRSESSLANKVRMGEHFTTLPSKYPLPGSKLRLSEKTVEARRVLLSDIGFTSMVPELSRSADHLCPANLKPPQVTTYGQFLRTPDLYSPGYAMNTSQRFTWTTTTATPSEASHSRYSSMYPLSPPAPSRRCSAPVSPSRRVMLKNTPSRVRFANGSLPELRGNWSVTMDSGDSTDSLVEEAENYLRRSIDCIVSGRDIVNNYGESKKGIRRASAPDASRDNIPPQGWQPFLPRLPRDLKLEHWVKVITPEGRVRGGRVRYIGPIASHQEQYVGVQLSTPDGPTDGTYGTRRYFQCEPYHGIFVPFKKVIMGWRP